MHKILVWWYMKKRKMKKWIPISPCYCHGDTGTCPWWQRIDETKHSHRREFCQFYYRGACSRDCNTCDEPAARCLYLNVIDYGQYPLYDMCKICGEHKAETAEWFGDDGNTRKRQKSKWFKIVFHK